MYKLMYTRCPNKHGELRDDFRCLNKLQRVFEKLKIVSLSKMWLPSLKLTEILNSWTGPLVFNKLELISPSTLKVKKMVDHILWIPRLVFFGLNFMLKNTKESCVEKRQYRSLHLNFMFIQTSFFLHILVTFLKCF